MTAQLDIFNTPAQRGRLSLKERFDAYHAMNPHVYRALVKLARQLVRRGHRNLGIKMLFEVLRWQSMIETNDPNPRSDEYKLCNDYTAHYARLMMAREPDLEGVFRLRELSR